MILALDTSTPVCQLSVYAHDAWHEYEWEAGRGLAKGLLGFIRESLSEYGDSEDFAAQLTGIVAFRGPGSFTGLRIGLTVVNTLASAKNIPIVGETGEEWRKTGLARLSANENDQLVMPEYGGEPHITTPRK